jgi:signal transduction histidine kinase
MDSPSSTTRPAQSVADFSRDEWVEMRLIHTFMRYARPALHSALVLIVVMVAVLYSHVDTLALSLWAAAAVAVTVVRYGVIGIYHRSLAGVSGPRLHAFMARYGWTWSASALVWGASMFVYFLRAPVYDQFLCMVVLVGMAGFAVGTFSSWLPCFKSYVNGLGIAVVAALLFELLMERGLPSTFNTYGMLALVLIYWAVIRISGQRFHEVQRVNLELQYDNSSLIRSLTEQSRAALEAVEIKNRFIASAAHDLRQPVHALDLYAGWLAAEPEFVEQITPKIVRSTKAVTDLFNSLFDLAGLETDPLRVNLQEVDLAGLLQDLEAQYAPFARERGLRLRDTRGAGQGGVGPGAAAAPGRQPAVQRAAQHAPRRCADGGAPARRRAAHRNLGHRRGHRRRAPAGDLPGVLPDSFAGHRRGFRAGAGDCFAAQRSFGPSCGVGVPGWERECFLG